MALLLASVLPTRTPLYKVERVVDGDTIKVEKVGTVRLLGINAPESVKPHWPVEPCGKEASAYMKALLTGKRVRLEQTQLKDRYCRTLAYVYLRGKDVNKLLIHDGMAVVYEHYPFSKRVEYRAEADKAKANKVGVWSDPPCGVQ